MNVIKYIQAVLIIFILTIHALTGTGSEYQPDTGMSKTDTLLFTVYGMDCPGCEGGLEKQLYKIPAIKYCKANWIKQELKIVLKKDSTLNIGDLDRRIRKANFTLFIDSEKEGK